MDEAHSPPIRIYTLASCGYCWMAKRLLNELGVVFEEIDVYNQPELRAWIAAESGQRTVPQTFVGDLSLGGYQELAALRRRGILPAVLAGELEP